jgi:acetyltransferase-like isoleucine patch superfamily enzyme
MAFDRLGEQASIDPAAKVRASRLGRYTEVGPRTSLIETTMDDYSYIMGDCDVIYTAIGKFCSIASHVRLNPGNHPTWRAATAI